MSVLDEDVRYLQNAAIHSIGNVLRVFFERDFTQTSIAGVSFEWWLQNIGRIHQAIENIDANKNDFPPFKEFNKTTILNSINQKFNDELTKKINEILENLKDHNKKSPEQTYSLIKRLLFCLSSGFIFLFEIFTGMSGIYSFADYICSALSFHFYTPLALGISVLFGLINAAISIVFDIKAVADLLDLPYLSACEQLNRLDDQTQKLFLIHNKIRLSLHNLSKHDAIHLSQNEIDPLKMEIARLQELMNSIKLMQNCIIVEVEKYATAFKTTRNKRWAIKLMWLSLALPIYACTAHLSALAFVPIISAFLVVIGFPPITLPVVALTLIFSLTWITIECFRFFALEGSAMFLGVEAWLGTPIDQLKKIIHYKDELITQYNENEKILCDKQTILDLAEKNSLKDQYVIIIREFTLHNLRYHKLSKKLDREIPKDANIHLSQVLSWPETESIEDLKSHIWNLVQENDALQRKVQELEMEIAGNEKNFRGGGLFASPPASPVIPSMMNNIHPGL